MMELLAMRHAKSDWSSDSAGDRDRPLAPRGVKAAKRMGKLVSSAGAAPDLVLSSPAVRARTTADLAAAAGGWGAAIEIVPAFYGGGWADVVAGIAAVSSPAGRILVVGHEPTWSELVSVLCGGCRIAMPTAAVACLAVDGDDWSRLAPGCAELLWHLSPRLIKGLS